MNRDVKTNKFRPLFLVALLLSALGACRSDHVRRAIDDRRSQLFEPGEMKGGAQADENATEETSGIQVPSLDSATLGDYTKYGLTMNAGVHSAFEKWRAAMERITQVTALPDPRFTFGQFVESVQTRTGPQENTFGLSQTFPWFGKLETRGEVQMQEANRLWAVVIGKQLAVELEIRSAFFEYAYLAQAVRITKENLVLLKRLEPVAQRKIQGGGGQDDLIRLQVEIGKVENEIETLQKFRQPLSTRIRAAINWPGSMLLPWPAKISDADRVYNIGTLKENLLRLNPELAALREEAEKHAKRAELANLDRWPDLTLGANYIATDNATMGGVAGSGDDPLLFTLSFNIPIQTRKYDAAEQEALASRAAAVAALAQKENDLFASLDLQAYKLDDAFRQVALYRDSLLPRARQALEVTEVAYRAGSASFTDLIDSQRVLLAFEKSSERARANYEQALAALKALCGGVIK